MEQVLRAECARLGLRLTDTQVTLLCRFAEAVLEQNKVMNLTAITAPEAAAKLHLADSLALLNAAAFSGKSVLDVGCGAGFPGVPLKLGEPSIRLTLLDSMQKRMNWLRGALAALGVEADCVTARAEDYAASARERYDLVVSRAVARLNVLVELCLPFVRVGGCFLAMKAADAREESDEARHAIAVLGGKPENAYAYTIDGAARRVLVIRKTAPTPPRYPRRFAKIRQEPL